MVLLKIAPSAITSFFYNISFHCGGGDVPGVPAGCVYEYHYSLINKELYKSRQKIIIPMMKIRKKSEVTYKFIALTKREKFTSK